MSNFTFEELPLLEQPEQVPTREVLDLTPDHNLFVNSNLSISYLFMCYDE